MAICYILFLNASSWFTKLYVASSQVLRIQVDARDHYRDCQLINLIKGIEIEKKLRRMAEICC